RGRCGQRLPFLRGAADGWRRDRRRRGGARDCDIDVLDPDAAERIRRVDLVGQVQDLALDEEIDGGVVEGEIPAVLAGGDLAVVVLQRRRQRRRERVRQPRGQQRAVRQRRGLQRGRYGVRVGEVRIREARRPAGREDGGAALSEDEILVGRLDDGRVVAAG